MGVVPQGNGAGVHAGAYGAPDHRDGPAQMRRQRGNLHEGGRYVRPAHGVAVRAAHRGQFDAEELRNVYAADAVFDDPCGTIRTPKGIVRGFELIHWLCDVDVEPTDDEWSLHPPAAGGLVFSEDAVPTLPAPARPAGAVRARTPARRRRRAAARRRACRRARAQASPGGAK